MPEQQAGGFNPLFVPVLMLLSARPDMESKVGNLAAMLEAMQNTLQTLNQGMQNFHATLTRYSYPQGSPSSPVVLPGQTPAPEEKSFPSIVLPEPPKE
ncbi:hypothetical protein [Desulfotomaculum copahuensis]|uniref:Uncharacterized protein n=1 Tax=Desulfotomaculum copahuensis TaxID=1838280 RepID=A0A1B7LFM8_9FIRM|nr:hypothetical protein [Desulfotomaculum copahuensis]OAT82952.1 hypothetical protein A6M21_08315 [Desulfotomaculum copahuensis]